MGIETVTTWRFWQALKNPPVNHPLFLRVRTTYSRPSRRRIIVAALVGMVAFEIGVIVLTANSRSLQPAAFVLSLILPVGLLAIIFNSTLYAVRWAVNVSGAITHEREARRYDLLCLLPSGTVGACMTICAGCLNFDSAFQSVAKFEKQRMNKSQAAFMVAVAVLVLYSYLSVDHPRETPLYYFAGLLLALAGYYVDYIQAAVLASLVGMLVSTYIHSQLDSRLWSGLGFLLLQTTTYLLTLLVGLVILPAVYQKLRMTSWLADLTVPILTLAAFIAMREALNSVLLRVVNNRLKMV